MATQQLLSSMASRPLLLPSSNSGQQPRRRGFPAREHKPHFFYPCPAPSSIHAQRCCSISSPSSPPNGTRSESPSPMAEPPSSLAAQLTVQGAQKIPAASSTADLRSKLHAAAACSFASRVECSTNRRSEPRPPALLWSSMRDDAFVFTPHVQQPRRRFDMVPLRVIG
ncbi:uncharacterized protein [Zea mays]|uniref:uncharacterized protein n=1 Tax=Zea mays TaxID=4577 RepID=UPI0004DE9028|nr:uncharacterized protein LOC109945255 [Zea mays]|eukprot:XP_020406689.1 uncharacterized protein LOC109945255 [Zea mays]